MSVFDKFQRRFKEKSQKDRKTQTLEHMGGMGSGECREFFGYLRMIWNIASLRAYFNDDSEQCGLK